MTKLNCDACKIEKHGIKTRVAVIHTCAKSDKKYTEPESKLITQHCSFSQIGNYYKVKIHQKIYGNFKATKYSIVRGQFLNGYKVPAGQEIWFPNEFHLLDTNLPLMPFIWLHESLYKKLAFV